MKLTDIITNEDLKASEKVIKLSSIIAKARDNYGNKEIEIPVPDIHTADGLVSLKFLTDEDKVALAGNTINTIRAQAIHIVDSTPGAMLDKEIESMLACDPILTNLNVKTESEYI